MIHRKTYQVLEESRELVYEDILNEKGQVLSYKDHQSPDQVEGFNDYNAAGLLVCEREVMDGFESSITEYQYDDKGNIVNRKLYVAEELFEEVIQEYTESGLISRTLQHGEETERTVETRNGEIYTKEYYQYDELVESHQGTYAPDGLSETVAIKDLEQEVIATRSRVYDGHKQVIRYEEKDGEGNTTVLSEYRYENHRVVFERQNNYEHDQHYEASYEYDAKGNQIASEVRSLSGKLMEFQKQVYDDQNRVISESGYTLSGFNTVYGSHLRGDKYTFEHEYEVGND